MKSLPIGVLNCPPARCEWEYLVVLVMNIICNNSTMILLSTLCVDWVSNVLIVANYTFMSKLWYHTMHAVDRRRILHDAAHNHLIHHRIQFLSLNDLNFSKKAHTKTSGYIRMVHTYWSIFYFKQYTPSTDPTLELLRSKEAWFAKRSFLVRTFIHYFVHNRNFIIAASLTCCSSSREFTYMIIMIFRWHNIFLSSKL